MTTGVVHHWHRIENWFKQHEPAFLDNLCKGASETAIKALETSIGLTLPEDYRAFLAIHDGEGSLLCDPGSMGEVSGDGIEEDAPLVCGILPFNGDLLPTEEIAAYRNQLVVCVDDLEDEEGKQVLADQCAKVQPVFYDSGWIPIAADPGHNEVFIDLNPTTEGQLGQLFIDYKEQLCRTVLANSFCELLEKYADDLEQGQYRIVKEDDTLSVVEIS